jgi:hypothetical protein
MHRTVIFLFQFFDTVGTQYYLYYIKINKDMAYLKIILEILSTSKKFLDFISKYLKDKKRIKQIKEVKEFEKEVKEKVENGTQDDIDDLNKKLRF